MSEEIKTHCLTMIQELFPEPYQNRGTIPCYLELIPNYLESIPNYFESIPNYLELIPNNCVCVCLCLKPRCPCM